MGQERKQMEQKRTETKYMALYSTLKKAIENGNYLTGSLLPTEKQMMEEYAVSRNTVRRAIAQLEMDGLISVSPGRGTQVIKGRANQGEPVCQIPYDVTTIRKVGWDQYTVGFSSSIIDVMQADTRLSEKLAVPPLTELYRVQRLKFCGGVPACYVVSYLVKEKLPEMERFNGQIMWLSKKIYDTYHISPLAAHEKVTVQAATFLEANLLRLDVGTPMMLVQRTAEYEQGLIEFTESFYNPEFFYIEIEMKGRPDYLISNDTSAI